MGIEVVPYRASWAEDFESVKSTLVEALRTVNGATVEHVGSTAVPGLAAKPILDIDVIVTPTDVTRAVAALTSIGYAHRGNLGVDGREAFHSPTVAPARHVYVCAAGALSVRNHLAVREVLCRREDLRDEYGAVKLALAASPGMDIDRYIAAKSEVLQKVLGESDLTEDELAAIWRLNTAGA